MEELYTKLVDLLGPQRVKEDEPMDSHTAFRAGGRARLYVEAEKTDEIVQIVSSARALQVPVKVLGSGTNMLVADKGFPGVIIKNNCRKFEVMTMMGKIRQQHVDVDHVLLFCESGAFLNQVVRYAIDEGLSGLEYQLGLPGTIGGAVYMNSQLPQKPAFVGDCVHSARVLSKDGEVLEVNREYFAFGFDYSSLQDNGDVLLSVMFALRPADKKVLWGKGMEASNYRISEQPRGIGTGYTFRNMTLAGLQKPLSSYYTQNVEQALKTAAVLDEKVGNVQLYEKRYNYILNMGEATISHVENLLTQVKQKVEDKTDEKLYVKSHVVEG